MDPSLGITDLNVNTLELILIAVTLALFSRVWVPWGERASGNLVGRETLSVLGRLRMHGPAAVLIFVLAVVLLALGKIGPLTVLLVTTLLALLLALPVRYMMTSQGIRAAWTPFRRWTEFGGVARRRGGVRLQGVAGARPLTVWLSGGRDDDEFVLLLRQLVRGSYKGQLGPEAGIPAPEAVPAGSAGPIGIAGAGGD
ncbi:MAG: hypothetical protein KY456_14090 [Chloroflexi bacterium]|nr:hypothetical protein [Chloroflexota bacterium]